MVLEMPVILVVANQIKKHCNVHDLPDHSYLCTYVQPVFMNVMEGCVQFRVDISTSLPDAYCSI